MTLKGMAVFAAALMGFTAAAVPASATTITYTYAGTFTGTNNGNPVTIEATFTGIGDTADVTVVDGVRQVRLISFTAVADGPYNIITPPLTFGVSADGTARLNVAGNAGSGLVFRSPSLVGYNGTGAVKAVTTPMATTISFATDRGNIVLKGQAKGTFNAVVSDMSDLPEAATWAMMLVGFGMIGFGMRYGIRRSNAKFDLKVQRIAAGLDA